MIEKMAEIKGYTAEDMGSMPVVALKGVVMFPSSVLHVEFELDFNIKAVEKALQTNRLVFVTAQKDPMIIFPFYDNQLYETGVVARVVQSSNNPKAKFIKVVLEGVSRAVAYNMEYVDESNNPDFFRADIVKYTYHEHEPTIEEVAKTRLVKMIFSEYVNLSLSKISHDIELKVKNETSAEKITNFVAFHAVSDYESKQEILEEFDVEKRLEILINTLKKGNKILVIQRGIIERTNELMEDNQKEFFLREQIRAIREELGDSDLDVDADYMMKIEKLEIDDSIKETLKKEARRLAHLPDASQEAYVIQLYLDTCLSLPWNTSSKDKIDIKSVEKALEKNHYGLKDIKERMLEYLAVRKLSPEVKGQIICLVGPPGVGKTSIAQSIGAAINKKVERVALGGIRDEAEIRGHRRTYVAAMPGRIISSIISAKTNNPLIILDEIDKLSSDYKGDPTSALLEVLDPEQNYTFKDHYIDLPFDLSNVMFITTANDKNNIPKPLLDRMEVIEIGSYTREEKYHIAKKHLIPKQLVNCGLDSDLCKFSSSVIYDIIDGYTSEAGVRNLERTIASVMRKVAKCVAESSEKKTYKIDSKNIEKYLGPRKYKNEDLPPVHTVGLVNGLAWTAVGGVTLPIEAAVVDGTGKTIITGSLGDVMKESAQIAITCVRERAKELGIDPDFYKNMDIHVHALEGAVPKDGPSAGITMTTAIVSALTKKPVNRFVAMTGEISLRGRVLPIGGLKEKAMGAYKAGVKTMIIPKDNESDVVEIDEDIRDQLKILPVETIDEVFEIAFLVDKDGSSAEGKKNSSKKKKSSVKNDDTRTTV